MSKAIDITMLGDKALQRRLNRLELKTGRKIVRRALRDAAKIHASAAKAEAPVDTGATKAGIRVRAVTGLRRGNFGVMSRTGTREEMGIPSDSKWYYPAIVEYGTPTTPANPFMRRAFEQNRQRMIDSIRRDLWSGIRSLSR